MKGCYNYILTAKTDVSMPYHRVTMEVPAERLESGTILSIFSFLLLDSPFAASHVCVVFFSFPAICT